MSSFSLCVSVCANNNGTFEHHPRFLRIQNSVNLRVLIYNNRYTSAYDDILSSAEEHHPDPRSVDKYIYMYTMYIIHLEK